MFFGWMIVIGLVGCGGGGGGGTGPTANDLVINSSSTITVDENQTDVITVTVADEGEYSFALIGGADAGVFLVDASTGVLRFSAAPDAEMPADSDGDNVYHVTVQARTASASGQQVLAVTVRDVNEAPVLRLPASIHTDENELVVIDVIATDPEGVDPLDYELSGEDAASFQMVGTQLRYMIRPDFENPDDTDSDGVYALTIAVSDGQFTDTQPITIMVDDINEAPVWPSGQEFSQAEGQVIVPLDAAVDPEGDTIGYSISGGVDAAHFQIDSLSGDLTFTSAPIVAAPSDANADNIYEVIVTADDGIAAPASMTCRITIYLRPFGIWSEGRRGTFARDRLGGIITDGSGGYVVAGTTAYATSFSTPDFKTGSSLGGDDIRVSRVDAQAERVWDVRLGGTADDVCSSISRAVDGAILIGGSSSSNARPDDKTEDAHNFSFDFWAIKLSSDGTRVWDRRYGSNGAEYCYAICALADGGVLMVGATDGRNQHDVSQDNLGYLYTSDCWVVRLDADGNKVWDRRFGRNLDDLGLCVAPVNDGFVIGGWSGTVSDDGFVEYSEAWAFKLTPDGTLVWSKVFDTPGPAACYGVSATPDDGVILACASLGPSGGDKTGPDYGGQDAWIIKLTSNGAIAWQQTHGGEGFDDFRSVTVDDEGIATLVGSSDSDLDQHRQLGGLDIWVAQFSPAGDLLWDTVYGTSATEYGRTIIPAADGSFLLGCQATGTIADYDRELPLWGSDDYWVVRIGPGSAPKRLSLDNDVITDTGAGAAVGYLTAVDDDPNPVLHYALIDGLGSQDNSKFAIVGDRLQLQSSLGDDSAQVYHVRIACTDDLGLSCERTFVLSKTTAEYRGQRVLPGDIWVPWEGDAVFESDGTATLISTVLPHAIDADEYLTTYGSSDYWVVKVDPAGDVIWKRNFGSDGGDEAKALALSADGGYLIGGDSSGGIGGLCTHASRGSLDMWVLRIDADGTVIWDQRFGGDGRDRLADIISVPDGGWLLVGNTESDVSGDISQANRGTYTDIWLVRIDGAGNLLWERRYGGDRPDWAKSGVYVNGAGFTITGYTSSTGGTGEVTDAGKGSNDVWLLHIDENGEPLWDRRYGGSYSDLGEVVQVLPDGGYLLGNTSYSDADGDRSGAQRGTTLTSDCWVVRVDGSGTILWEQTYGGSADDEVNALVTFAGHSVFVGRSRSHNSGEKSEAHQGRGDFWLVGFDTATGELLWDRTIGSPVSEGCFHAGALADGGIIIGGSTGVPYDEYTDHLWIGSIGGPFYAPMANQ